MIAEFDERLPCGGDRSFKCVRLLWIDFAPIQRILAEWEPLTGEGRRINRRNGYNAGARPARRAKLPAGRRNGENALDAQVELGGDLYGGLLILGPLYNGL